ncbi:MAG TPA: serine/threonine-protein kinase [Vicinamibacterales bacterium]|nr:serine/threonine-protein kinase [Vicinamibacterales bacterium]
MVGENDPPVADPDSSGQTHTSDGRGEPTTTRRRTWGDLELRSEIGAGGYGRVYRARDATLARDVALKVIALRDAEHAAEVLREGQMLARVRHPNVVTVHSARRIGDEVGLTMELVDGQHLGDVIRLRGPMGAEEAAIVGVRLCQALAAVHAAGLVHRDVKARNVMREAGGRIVLMDFGTGRELADAPRGPGDDLSGTPLYMAPELFAGGTASAASDLYSLGVLLFHLVTAKYPVNERSAMSLVIAHASGQRRLLSDVRPDLPVAFVQVVERALMRDPAQRFASSGAMMTALSDTISSGAAGIGDHGRVLPATGSGEAGAVARPRIGRVLAGVALGASLLLFFGMATSAAYNLALGRVDGFSDDTLLDWWIYGVQSVVPVAIYAALTLIVAAAVRALWRLGRPGRATGDRRPLDPARAAQALLVAQAAALVLILWGFGHVWPVALGYIESAEPEALRVLSVSSDVPVYFRQALTVALVFTVLGWRAVLSRPDTRRVVDTVTRLGAAAIAIVMVLLLEVPYRLMFKAHVPVVEHAGLTCYELGRRPSEAPREVLTYCPAWATPRIRAVAVADVNPTTRRGNVFD